MPSLDRIQSRRILNATAFSVVLFVAMAIFRNSDDIVSAVMAQQKTAPVPWTSISEVPLNAWYRPTPEYYALRGQGRQPVRTTWRKIVEWSDVNAECEAYVVISGETFGTSLPDLLIYYEWTVGDRIVNPCGNRK